MGADGVQPLFSKSLDDLEFARSIAKHPLVTEDAFNGAKCLAMASGLSDLCAILQLKMHTDIVRIALAKLALSFAHGNDDSWFETQVAALQVSFAAINVFKAAANFDAASVSRAPPVS